MSRIDFVRIANLEAEIARLQSHRRSKELSDDFALTNGTLARLDEEIAAKRHELAQLEQPTLI